MPCSDALTRTTRLLRYAGANGAARYVLEGMAGEGLSGNTAGSGAARSRAQQATGGTRGGGGGWQELYRGRDTMATLTGLCPNTSYRIRARAVNVDGAYSDWSIATRAYTLTKGTKKDLTKANAAE